MKEFYSMITYQNETFVDLIPISLNISTILNRSVIKISKDNFLIIFHLITDICKRI